MVDVAVPAAPPASSLRRVELAHTGQWRIGSGLWNASREDFVAAVAALDCPAVRRPVLKLGHSQGEQPLWAGNPTGEPAVGWVDNLATTNSDHTLVGDFVDMPGWFGGIAASAYPDRSIEGTHDFRCQIGHTHPFVVTAVALLGVTRPGVGTLKSLQDVGRLYGVQADSGAGTRVVAQFDPGQPRAPRGAPAGIGGQWVSRSGGGLLNAGLDKLKLADRIPLRGDERLVASGSARGHENDALLALTQTPTGPELRLGITHPEDTGRWSGANRGGTARLDSSGMARLRQTLDVAAGQGREFQRRLRELSAEYDRVSADRDRVSAEYTRHLARRTGQFTGPPELEQRLEALTARLNELDADPGLDSDATLAEGFIPGAGWGDVAYQLVGVDDGEGGWALRLAVRPEGADASWDIYDDAAAEERSVDFEGDREVGRLLGQLDDMLAVASVPVAASAAAPRGWLDSGHQQGDVRAHLPGQHNQQTHGRRYGPGGTLLRGPRRLVRATRRQTVRALDRTLADLAGDEAATRPGMTGGPLVDLVAGVRDGVDGGQFTPEQAMQLLSSLVFRPDVASNPRLSTALGELTGRLRDGDRRDAPDVPDVPDVPEPTRPDAGQVGPLRRTRAPAEVADDLPQRLRDATSSDQARGLLSGLTAAQLRTVADEVGAAHAAGWRKQRIADSIVRRVVGFRETFDAIERLGGPGAGQISAAADVRTGAMVALIPSEEDLDRLAVPGGEDRDQLHVTLLFLGEAVAYPPEVRERLVAELREVAEVIPPGPADGFAVAAFNPNSTSRDTAIVLELGGDGLEDVHGLVEAAVDEVATESGLVLPEQHSPWRPHICLMYTDDLWRMVEMAGRTGPVRFDRLRVAFAGENVDIPLTGEPADDLDVENLTDDDMPLPDGDGQVVAQQSRRITRSDRPLRRYWLRGAGAAKIRWNTPGDWTRCVRQLRRHVRDPKGLCAVYHRAATGVWPGDRRNVGRRNASAPEEAIALPNPNPTIIHAAAAVSVDDVRTAYYRQAPHQAWIREFHTSPKRLIVANDADGTVARVDFDVDDDGSISFAAPVPVRVEYVEDSEPEKVAASRMVYASAAESRPSVVTQPPPPPGFQPADVQAATVSNRPWSDFDESDYSPEQWRRATLLDRGQAAGDVDTKQRYSLPVREPDGTLNRNGVHAAAGGHGIGAVGGISDELRRGTARKVVRLYRDELGEEPPESLLELAGMQMSASADPPPETPAAEPGNPSTKEDDMPLSTEVYQRLGLAEDAEADAVNAAVLAALDKAAEEPDPQQVAAAAAENENLRSKVQWLEEQVQNLSSEIAGANAEKVAKVKASVIDEAVTKGRIAPADKDKWAERYDKAPDAVADVLASIADGAAVPVTAQGKVGDPWDVAAAELPAEPSWLFSNPEPALAGSETKEN